MPIGETVRRPPPVDGLNTAVPAESLRITEASVFQNVVAASDGVKVRPGKTAHKDYSGDGIGNISSLYSCVRDDGVWDLYWYDNLGRVYSEYNGGTPPYLIGIIDGTDFTGRAMFERFDKYLVALTMTHKKGYKIDTSSTPQTGAVLSTTPPISPQCMTAFKNRMYYGVGGDFYYTALDAVDGAVTKFPLSRLGGASGDIVVFESWTVDTGAGLDDMLVIVLAGGDLFLYSGPSPADAAWTLSGHYKIPPPFDPRGVLKVADDLMIIVKGDIVSLREMLTKGEMAVRSRVSGLMQSGLPYTYCTNLSATVDSGRNLAIFSFGYGGSGDTGKQLVFSLQTGKWSEWAVPATSFAYVPKTASGGLGLVLADFTYTISTMDDAVVDDTGAIVVRIRTGWDPLNGGRKRVAMMKSIFNAVDKTKVTEVAKFSTNFSRFYSTTSVNAVDHWVAVGVEAEAISVDRVVTVNEAGRLFSGTNFRIVPLSDKLP